MKTDDKDATNTVHLWCRPEANELVDKLDHAGFKVVRITTGSVEPVAEINGSFFSGFGRIVSMLVGPRG
jgi:hypothetical protein